MILHNKRIGIAMSGSHHSLEGVLSIVPRLLREGADLTPIVSHSIQKVTTSFGTPEQWLNKIEEVFQKKPLMTIPEVEPIGPKRLLDLLLVAPCTGNTLAKIANALTDSPVTMAFKCQQRIGRPVVLSITTNDALGLNAKNLARLLTTKNVYFVPFGQDQPFEKPNSLVAHLDLVIPTILAALRGEQYQPLLVPW